MSSYTLHGATLHGMDAMPVSVEVDITGGLPGMTIVGIPDSAVLEARYRIRCALKACGFEIPRMHITINLAPSDIRKTGGGFDLPIAAAILAATEQIPLRDLDKCLFVGELRLTGELCDVRGSLAYAILARDMGLRLVGPKEFANSANVLFCDDMKSERLALGMTSLAQLALGVDSLEMENCDTRSQTRVIEEAFLDYEDVADQETAKRAFTIAAVGGHGLLMMGPPGSGKTMLARRLPTIMPTLNTKDRLEAMLIHSVCSQSLDSLMQGIPPFRAPHHSSTIAGLVGGGHPVKPGEISLAHKGVLFLDELPEFGSSVLQALRQPMEDKVVNLVRVEGSYSFPSEFQLIAAANPCPCGHLGDPGYTCKCSNQEIVRYQGKIGGALLDRIDMFIDVARPKAADVIEGKTGTSSQTMKDEVVGAREFRAWRASKSITRGVNSFVALGLSSSAAVALERYANKLCLGGRGITRTARVARSIADLRQSELVEPPDIAEACSYRSRLSNEGDMHV